MVHSDVGCLDSRNGADDLGLNLKDEIPCVDFCSGGDDAWVGDVAKFVREEGVCVIRNVWDAHDVTRMLGQIETLEPKSIVKRRTLRWDMVHDATNPIFETIYQTRPQLEKVLCKVLGAKFYLEKVGLINAEPGARVQRWHMDTPHLFSAPYHLPAHSINCFISTCDLIPGPSTNGPTEFQLGTHMKANLAEKKRMANAYVPIGSLVVYDTRIMHRGGANHSDDRRCLIYMTFSRQWYRDTINP